MTYMTYMTYMTLRPSAGLVTRRGSGGAAPYRILRPTDKS